jgi:hypothetical protein
VRLGRLDLAEETLERALDQTVPASGHSYRRRAAVLVDLAVIGARRRDPDQVMVYAREALDLARSSSSGYVAHRLRTLCDELGPLSRNRRIAGLGAEIATLKTP